MSPSFLDFYSPVEDFEVFAASRPEMDFTNESNPRRSRENQGTLFVPGVVRPYERSVATRYTPRGKKYNHDLLVHGIGESLAAYSSIASQARSIGLFFSRSAMVVGWFLVSPIALLLASCAFLGKLIFDFWRTNYALSLIDMVGVFGLALLLALSIGLRQQLSRTRRSQ